VHALAGAAPPLACEAAEYTVRVCVVGELAERMLAKLRLFSTLEIRPRRTAEEVVWLGGEEVVVCRECRPRPGDRLVPPGALDGIGLVITVDPMRTHRHPDGR
jgi:hypothetical protein